jgi:hypothetical protein
VTEAPWRSPPLTITGQSAAQRLNRPTAQNHHTHDKRTARSSAARRSAAQLKRKPVSADSPTARFDWPSWRHSSSSGGSAHTLSGRFHREFRNKNRRGTGKSQPKWTHAAAGSASRASERSLILPSTRSGRARRNSQSATQATTPSTPSWCPCRGTTAGCVGGGRQCGLAPPRY